MNALIMNTLKPLGIVTRFMKYDGNEKEYIIFNIPSNKDSFFCDDDNEAEINTVSLTFWYQDGASFPKIKDIKKTMKNAGFIYINGVDLIEDEYFGRNMIFKYLDIQDLKK